MRVKLARMPFDLRPDTARPCPALCLIAEAGKVAEPGGICVSARVQEDAAGKLDLAFEDMGEQALKNIARPVLVFRVGVKRVVQSSEPPGALPLPDKPSVAVLPFTNMSGDPEQEYFADGMVEEIITALSRIRWLWPRRSNPRSS